MYKAPWNLNDQTINKWPYWLFEENIKLINGLNETSSTNQEIINLADPSTNAKGL
jgi:hypothetical protein